MTELGELSLGYSLLERGAGELADFEGFWKDFQLFQQSKHADGRTPEQVLSP